MNSLILLLTWTWTWSFQNIISILGIVGVAVYFVFMQLAAFAKQKEKIKAYLKFGNKVLPVDFPEPVSVEVIKPNPEDDPNRMIWNISQKYIDSSRWMDLQKYLEANLNSKLNLSIKVYDQPKGGVSINLRKKNDMDWEEITISAEEHLKIFFERSIDFERKKDEVVAST